VDGSHIRTLLLTFFYRQMAEIIENGYLYIAQPPLFRIGKGKNEIYLKDETEFNDFILKKISEKIKIKISSTDELLIDHKLYLFICSLNEYVGYLDKLENQGIPVEIIETMIYTGIEDKSFFQDEGNVNRLRDSFDQKGYDVGPLKWNEEKQIYEIMISHPEGIIKIGRGFVYSTEYQRCFQAGKNVIVYNHPPFTVISGENDSQQVKIDTIRELGRYMMEEGKKGINVQRYKGLGEMNPDQLWETTMNPEKRNLLQVRVEDALDSDEIFTILMGDQVEPRREFIQNNALEVSLLDI